MKTFLFLSLFSLLSLNPDNGLEKRVADLEKEVEVLTTLILSNDIRSRLSFGVNRNFIYNGSYYSSWNNNGTKLIHHFNGYLNKPEFDKKYKDQKIFMVRNYIQNITEIILGAEGQWYEKASLEINFYDAVYSNEPVVMANTENKSIKILLDGLLTDVDWQ